MQNCIQNIGCNLRLWLFIGIIFTSYNNVDALDTNGQAILSEIIEKLDSQATKLQFAHVSGKIDLTIDNSRFTGKTASTNEKLPKIAGYTDSTLEIDFRDWGYIAKNIRPESNVGDTLANTQIAVRSNTLSVDYSERLRGNAQTNLSMGTKEANIRNSETPSFVPLQLNPIEFKKLLLNLESVSYEWTNGADGEKLILVSGQRNVGNDAEQWQILFAPSFNMFPLVTKVFLHGKLYCLEEATINPTLTNGLFYPNEFTVRLFRMGDVFYKQVVHDIIVDFQTSNQVSQYTFNIPVGTLVDEYRYQKPFTYIMGAHPPTEAELEAMSASTAAIYQYEKVPISAVPYQPSGYITNPKIRWIVLIMLSVTSVGALVLVWKSLRKRS